MLSQSERDALIVANLRSCRQCARLVWKTVWQHAEYDDLYAEAVYCMVRCAGGFAPERGVSFCSYAWLPMRNGLIDYVRRQPWFRLAGLMSPGRAANLPEAVPDVEDGVFVPAADCVDFREPHAGDAASRRDLLDFVTRGLDASEKAILTLRYQMGLSFDEIDGAMGYPYNRRLQHFRLIRRLRRRAKVTA